MIDLLFLLLNIGEDVFIYLMKKDCGGMLLNMEISFMNIHWIMMKSGIYMII